MDLENEPNDHHICFESAPCNCRLGPRNTLEKAQAVQYGRPTAAFNTTQSCNFEDLSYTLPETPKASPPASEALSKAHHLQDRSMQLTTCLASDIINLAAVSLRLRHWGCFGVHRLELG